MTKKLKWRLSSLPTPSELQGLVKDEIITLEEAREILLSSEDVDERDKKSLEEEIKFLRRLIEQLSSNNNTKIIETIKYFEKPYERYSWYEPYNIWTSNDCGAVNCSSGVLPTNLTVDFSSIKTF